jgi:hypothetical protein
MKGDKKLCHNYRRITLLSQNLLSNFHYEDKMYRHVKEGLSMGFGLVNGFIDHLYTRIGTTSNYSATANLQNSQITTAPAKPFPACCVFTSHSPAKASNSGDVSALHAQVLSSQTPVRN